MTRQEVIWLQRTVGNQVVGRRLAGGMGGVIQRTLVWAGGQHRPTGPADAPPANHVLKFVPARNDNVWIDVTALASYPLPFADPRDLAAEGATAPAGLRPIGDDDIKAEWKKSQFKVLYDLTDGTILAVRNDKNDGLTQSEYDALLKVELSGLRTPNPELVSFHGHKAIRMQKVEGTFVDINKIEAGNSSVRYKMMVLAISNGKVDTSEAGLLKLLRTDVHHRLAPPEAVAMLKTELARVLKASQKVAINDLQAIVGGDGKLTIIDPQWAGNPKELGADEMMVRNAYMRTFEIFTKLGGDPAVLTS